MHRDFVTATKISADLTFAKGILLLDQCANTLPWVVEGTGTDYQMRLSREGAFFGKSGYCLKTRLTTPAANDIVTAWRLVPFPETQLLVYRLLFAVEQIPKTSAVFIRADFNDGEHAYAAGIKWLPHSPSQLKYLDNTGTYQDVSDEGPYDSGGWISLELVVGLEDHEYIFCTFNGTKYSLKDIEIYDEGVVNDRYHIFGMGHVAKVAAQSIVYFDSIYIGEFLSI